LSKTLFCLERTQKLGDLPLGLLNLAAEVAKAIGDNPPRLQKKRALRPAMN